MLTNVYINQNTRNYKCWIQGRKGRTKPSPFGRPKDKKIYNFAI